jgi:hypothetical protein
LKTGSVCVPSKYAALVRTARKNGAPFKFQELDHGRFLDLKKRTEKHAVKCTVDLGKEKFNLIVFASSDLRKSTLIISSLQHLTRILSLNVLMSHQGRLESL